MSENTNVPEPAPDRVQVDQARAWLAVLHPSAAERWEQDLEIADLTDDETRYVGLRRALVDDWLSSRDDPIDHGTRRVAEHAQGVAWLGERSRSWRRAHALAVNRDESDADVQILLSSWHQHRDETTVPESLIQTFEALRAVREERVEAAKGWFRRHNPRYFSEWETCRHFADTVEGEWNDDRHLVTRHLAELKVAVSTRQPPGREQKNGPAERESRTLRGRLAEWLTPPSRRSRPNSDRGPLNL